MSLRTTEEWDERYRRAEYWAGAEPVAFLQQMLPLLPRPGTSESRGHALDLAMGEGRNAVFLAQNGWHVTGVDRSAAALDKAEALARSRGVEAARAASESHVARRGCLTLVQADLEQHRLPQYAFDVVLCFYYLQRSLFPAMEEVLRPGGVLVFETYTVDQLQYPEGPRCPEHLLHSGELRQAFPRLHTLFYAEHNAGKGIACLLARKPR